MSFCSFRERCKSRNHNNKHFESPSVSAAAVLKISTFQRVQITTGGLHSLLLVSAVVVEAVISSLSLSQLQAEIFLRTFSSPRQRANQQTTRIAPSKSFYLSICKACMTKDEGCFQPHRPPADFMLTIYRATRSSSVSCSC